MSDMLACTCYADDTGLYIEEECEVENLTDIFFPAPLVRAWYEEELEQSYGMTFADWYENESIADDFICFCDYAREHGFTPKKGD